MAIGDSVIYVDSLGVERDALVTEIWGRTDDPQNKPGINLVIVSNDDSRRDTYGRQVERFTSIVHRGNQAAHGNYWKERQ